MIHLRERYTWRNRLGTATITHYCPICRTVMEVTEQLIRELSIEKPATHIDAALICCSAACAQPYKEKQAAIDKQKVAILERSRSFGRRVFLPTLRDLTTQAMDELLNQSMQDGAR